MEQIGKYLVLFGIILVLAGGLIWGLGRLGYRGLPGDIHIEGENVRFYFPIVTCIVLSVLLTLILWLWQWFHRQ